MGESPVPFAFSIIILLIGGLLYSLGLVVYRLFFSPLARFPGPRIAAATGLYEFYYDALRGGQYIWKVEQMHRKYGPVVRIRPDEIHVYDPDFYAMLHTSGTQRRDKVARNARQFGAPDSLLAAVHHNLHRMRRATLAPFFSKASVYKLEPVIRGKVDEIIERMEGFKLSRQSVPVFKMFTAFTSDVVMEYAFGRSDNRLLHPEFDPVLLEAMAAAGQFCHWTLHMNWVLQFMQALPVWLAKLAMPGLGRLVAFQDGIKDQIRDIQDGRNLEHEKTSQRTIFHHMLNSDMPDSEKRLERMWQEGMIVVGAGTETTAWTLVVGFTSIMLDYNIRQRLETELQIAMADDPNLPLVRLEQLPYLSACIKEALRLSYGVTSRLPRVSPDQVLEVPGTQGLQIMPGTKVSMTSVFIHRNPQIFPSPDQYNPNRWLDNPRLERYLVSYAKGARQCLGINLANAELYLALGTIFGRFPMTGEGPRLQLLDAKNAPADIEIAGDMFVPATRSGNKHVKAIFR